MFSSCVCVFLLEAYEGGDEVLDIYLWKDLTSTLIK